jgi:methyl-accepting chemotaxis protein
MPDSGANERRLLDDLQRINSNIDGLRVKVAGAMREADLVELRQKVADMLSTMAARVASYRSEQNRADRALWASLQRKGTLSRVLAVAALLFLVGGLALVLREALGIAETLSGDVSSLQKTLGRWLSGGYDPWTGRSETLGRTLEGPLEVLRNHLVEAYAREREAQGYHEAMELLETGVEDALGGRECPAPPDHPASSAIARVWSRLGHAGERTREEAVERERTAERLREELGKLHAKAGDLGSHLRAFGMEVGGVPGSPEWWDGVGEAVGSLAVACGQSEEGKIELRRMSASAADMLDRLTESIREIGDGIAETVEGQQHQVSALHSPTESVERLMGRVSLLLEEVGSARRGLEELIKQASMQAHRSLGIADRAAEVQGLIEQVAEVAKKTNLLALNAAIEAAGAGEYGKGFAVVAKEIRNLAIRSAQTAETLGATIADMRKQSTMSVLTAEEEGKMARKAAEALERYSPALGRLSSGLDEFRRLMDESRGSFKDGMRSGGALREKVGDAVSSIGDLADRFRLLSGGGHG